MNLKKILAMILAMTFIFGVFTAMPLTVFAEDSGNDISDDIITGWQEQDGVKYFYKEDGTKAVGLFEIEGEKYFFSEDGTMTIGWKNIDDKRYYFGQDGKAVGNWQKINNYWYFFDNDDNTLQTGWFYDGNNLYFLKESFANDETELGVMETGWVYWKEKWFFLNADGAMLTGFQIINNVRYYLYKEADDEKGIIKGQMATGWTEVDEDKYYFIEEGVYEGSPLTGWNIIDNVRYMFDKHGKVVKGAKEFIIDVSKWQGKIDWTKIKGQVDGVIARTSHGSGENWKDVEFENYIEALNELEIPYGLYHYNEATTVEEARKEAQMAIEYVKSTKAKPTMPFFVDIEQDGGKCDLIAIAKVYIEEFIKNGYMPGIYANQNYWRNYLNAPEFTLYYRWIANYGKNDGTANPEFAPEDGIENYMMWQYTSVTIMDGITENSVDCNILFDWYKKPDGWKFYNGKWYFYKDGYLLNNWQIIDNKWYFFTNSGEMGTGWQFDGRDWYLLDNGGQYLTGWYYSNGIWYFMDTSGRMATGWRYISNKWYHFSQSGAMSVGWIASGSAWYFADASGAMQTGWQYISGKWYYFSPDGNMYIGWILSGNNWYYLKNDGSMASNCYIGNYWLNANGVWE